MKDLHEKRPLKTKADGDGAALVKEMLAGLKGIGFKHDIVEDGTGHQLKYFRRGGGYNLGAGSSALMIRGIWVTAI